MSRFAQLRGLSWRRSSPRSIHPEEWPEERDKPRVLIENPDGADLWAHAEILREAGYDVAMCAGPAADTERVPWFRRRPLSWVDPQRTEGQGRTERRQRTVCPLIAEGHCPLVEGADVVVSTTRLTDSREILATLSARSSPALVVEGTSDDLERSDDVIGDAVQIKLPVLPEQIVDAVERARSPRAVD
jgi:hypothetical protein